MFRCLLFCTLFASPALAEVCDRSKYRLTEAKEADEPVIEARINFTYESGVFVHQDGARETVYCIRNDESAPIYVKWHGPKPGTLFQDYALGGGREVRKWDKKYEDTTTDDRKIEYGLTKNYGKETHGDTYTFTDATSSAQLFPAQATPLDVVGLSMPDLLADAELLDTYLEAYQNAPEGGNELVVYAYAKNWLPADREVLAQLAAGQEIESYEGPVVPVSYGLRSAINIDGRLATSSVQFWFGHFEANGEAFALAQAAEIHNRLSVVAYETPFSDLADLDEGNSYLLSEAGVVLNQDILQAKVGNGATVEFQQWTVGLAFDGIPFTAMQAELFAN